MVLFTFFVCVAIPCLINADIAAIPYSKYDRKAKPVRDFIAKYGASLVSPSPSPSAEEVTPSDEQPENEALLNLWQGDYEELGIPMPENQDSYFGTGLPPDQEEGEKDPEALEKQRNEDFRHTREMWLRTDHDLVDLEPPASTNYCFAMFAEHERYVWQDRGWVSQLWYMLKTEYSIPSIVVLGFLFIFSFIVFPSLVVLKVTSPHLPPTTIHMLTPIILQQTHTDSELPWLAVFSPLMLSCIFIIFDQSLALVVENLCMYSPTLLCETLKISFLLHLICCSLKSKMVGVFGVRRHIEHRLVVVLYTR